MYQETTHPAPRPLPGPLRKCHRFIFKPWKLDVVCPAQEISKESCPVSILALIYLVKEHSSAVEKQLTFY